MSCSLNSIALDEVASGETWGGFTFTIDSSDDTIYAATLSRVRMTWRTSAGAPALTLDSNTVGQITINTATAYAWSFTIEPVTLGITAGWYSWAVESTDADGVVNKDFMAGTQQITADPHS